MSTDEPTADQPGTRERLEAERESLEAEIARLRAGGHASPAQLRTLERDLASLRSQLSTLSAQNERLVRTLRDAREQIVTLKSEVDRLAQPPAAYGIVIEVFDGGTADILTSGRKMHVAVSPSIEEGSLVPGREVMLNEAMNVVAAHGYETTGEVVLCKEILADGRVLVVAQADEERVCRVAASLDGTKIRAGDALLLESRSGFVFERIPKAEVADLVLEEVPDIDYTDIGGLSGQIEAIRDAVELPYLHPDLYTEHELKPPKGVLLYGPPGCGKTMIAKAVAASLARKVAEKEGREPGKSYFLNIKGPELLNKYVGETERHIRLIFQRAREKSNEGYPVVVFFDEMESLFRTRGSGVSSDVETTIVPQLLSEIDGVEGLEHVIVIGASNREDMIDPAILRPGRLDVKIKIERPDAEAARDIFAKYLTASLPLHPDDVAQNGGSEMATVEAMIDATVLRMYTEEEENRFLEVTYAGWRQGDPLLQGLQLRCDDPEHRRPRQEDGDQGLPRHGPAGASGGAPPPVVHRRVPGERGPAEHDEPRRLGPDLRQEGGADRLHPHPHQDQGGHRAGQVDQHGRQHRPVPLTRRRVARGPGAQRGGGRSGADPVEQRTLPRWGVRGVDAVEEAGDRLALVDPADRLRDQPGDGAHAELRPASGRRNRVGGDDLGDHRVSAQALHRLPAEEAVGARHGGLGHPLVGETVEELDDRATGGDLVVEDDGPSARDVTDDGVDDDAVVGKPAFRAGCDREPEQAGELRRVLGVAEVRRHDHRAGEVLRAEVVGEDAQGGQVVHGHREEAVDLRRVEVHRQNPVRSSGGDEVGDETAAVRDRARRPSCRCARTRSGG